MFAVPAVFGCAYSNPVASGSGSVLGGVIFLLESIYWNFGWLPIGNQILTNESLLNRQGSLCLRAMNLEKYCSPSLELLLNLG